MIVLYTYDEHVLRFTNVASVNLTLSQKHSLLFYSGKWRSIEPGWRIHQVMPERGHHA
jgi:hypothetical protein